MVGRELDWLSAAEQEFPKLQQVAGQEYCFVVQQHDGHSD